MKKLTRAIKLALLVSSLAMLPFANAAKNNSPVTIDEAKAFIEATNILKKEVTDTVDEAWYIRDRFWTLDTDNHRTQLYDKAMAVEINSAYQAIQYKDLDLNKDLTRRLNDFLWMGDYSPSHPHPENDKKVTLLEKTTDDLTKKYAANTVCINQGAGNKSCLNTQQISEKMASSSNESELKSLWTNWHHNLTPFKPLFQQQVQLNNEGAQRFGFSNRAEMQLSEFEMPVNDFINELDQAWADVKPLYDSLLLHVRNKLTDKYGAKIVKPNQPIPAHLLGSLGASNLGKLYELVKPEGAVTDRGYNINEKLKQHPEMDVPAMVHGQEKYMVSMGFAPFKKSLYEFSQFTKPTTHKAACDPTAWFLPQYKEARVAGCWEVNEETFRGFNTTGLLTPTFFRISHANQPIWYNGQYSRFPAEIFRGAGRALKYAYTPDYLQTIGMLDEIPDGSADLGYLMKLALNTVASMPYKLAINKWQKEVASGDISATEYNKRWWQLREHYQGITTPVGKDSHGFDAGASREIIHNQSPASGFVAEILGFQFYQSLCKEAGNRNILSRCSFYGSKEVGTKLQEMFALGNSRAWYDVMSAVTGQTKLDGEALTNYFAPLQEYLDQQNEN